MGKGRPCGPCGDERRNELDRRLLEMDISGETFRGLSRIYGYHEDALRRHKDRHLAEPVADVLATMKQAREIALQEAHNKELEDIKDRVSKGTAARLDNAANFLDQLREVRRKAADLLDKAEEAADTKIYGSPANYLRELREQIRLLAELEGRLPQAQVNLTLTAEWISLRTVIITSLDPFPEAKAAMITAIESHRVKGVTDGS